MTRLEDAELALEHGATALGFVFWPRSPRYVTPERASAIIRALPARTTTVGVFVNATMDEVRRVVGTAELALAQLHGDERAHDVAPLGSRLIKSVTLENVDALDAEWPEATTFLLDAADPQRRGGTGVRVDWDRAAVVASGRRRIILAGGLTPENVADAVGRVRPYGVDVASGVEQSPGIKDAAKVKAFLANARAAFEQMSSAGASEVPAGGAVTVEAARLSKDPANGTR